MFSSAFPALLLLAFFGAAGAVPLCRKIYSRASTRGLETSPVSAAPAIAGAGMLFGMVISLFYVDLWPSNATDLLLASAFVVLGGAGWRKLKRWNSKAPPAYQWVVSVLAVLIIVAPLHSADMHWDWTSVAVLVLAMITPVTVSLLSRSNAATPALPAGIVLIQLVLLLLYGALGSYGVAPSAQYQGMAIIVLPAIGSLIGVLVYLCRMPWRQHAAISTTVATRLCLGILVAWGAIVLGPGSGAGPSRTAGLLWILAIPVFEALRMQTISFLKHRRLEGKVVDASRSVREVSHSPASMGAMALILGGVGIILDHWSVSDLWTALALLPAFLVYATAPALLKHVGKRHAPGTADAPG